MDPASAAIGIAAFGFTVFNKFNEVLKTIRGASEQLEALRELSTDIEVLLAAVETANSNAHVHFRTPAELEYLERLRARARRHLEAVNDFAEKVQRPSQDGTGAFKVKVFNWFIKKKEFDDILGKMNDLRSALGLIMVFVNSRSQENVERILGEVHINVTALRGALSPRVMRRQIEGYSLSCSNGPLRCLYGCDCRCHALAFKPIIHKRLVPYVGQVYVPRRLFHPPWSSWSRCDVQTCRGDLLEDLPVRWLLPSRAFSIQLRLGSSNHPIYLSIGTPRLVARNAPIWHLVESGDVDSVRDLFQAKKASVYDVTDAGGSLITFACRAWQQKPCKKALSMISFLVNAGADAGFAVSTNMSAQDYLVLMSFKYLLVNRGKAFIASVTTSPVAVDIFRSLLDIDTVDAIGEYLERRDASGLQELLGLAGDNGMPATPTLSVSAFRLLTKFTPLEYATILAPQYVPTLLERGEDAVAGAPLCYAVGWGHTDFIKPMLDAGADVNARDPRGRTALHYVCFYGRHNSLQELLRWADDIIDWNACTPAGKNALDLLNEGVSTHNLSPSELDDFLTVLRVRVREFSGDESVLMPGAFPDPASTPSHV